jgi:hypothetical protein
MTTYLCGGINGLSDADCRDWRESAKSLLETDTLDPMRRDYRGREDESVKEIVHGDYADIDASDFVLANAVRPSWGTAIEIHYAYTRGIPVIAWTGDARVSPWLRYHCASLHPALGAAIEDINARNKSTVPRKKDSVRGTEKISDAALIGQARSYAACEDVDSPHAQTLIRALLERW